MRYQPLRGLAALCSLALLTSPPRAPGQGPGPEPRVGVGQCVSPHGTVLHRRAPGLAWEPLGPKDRVFSRDTLLALPGVRGNLDTQDGGLRLTLWGNLPEL